MALRRRTGARFETNTWAGFVDAMTALLLVMVFILSIFMIMQFFLRETIKGQGRELTSLSGQLAQISQALGAKTIENNELTQKSQGLETRLAKLQFDYDQQSTSIASFEEQVASLLARNTQLQQVATDTEIAAKEALSQKQQLELALAAAQGNLSQEQIDAKLAQARAEALQAMVDANTSSGGDLKSSMEQVLALAALAKTDQTFSQSETGQQLANELDKLSVLEQQKIADQAAAEFLREKLKNSETELTAMTLSLEAERKRAEDTLTLIAAIDAQRTDIAKQDISEAEKGRALLNLANEEISVREKETAAQARQIALLNQQTAELRTQMGALQNILDASAEKDAEARVQLEALGTSLNAALARVAAEEKKRADNLEGFRSDFFGKLKAVLGDVSGIQIVGDRFVFSSEVLFAAGSAELSAEGQQQIGQVANLLNQISDEFPPELNWVLRVDGHTDIQPLVNSTKYKDNWELSQARALSVVRYMSTRFNVNPKRLAAAGFGEYHPIAEGTSTEALARNRRIELKLTEQ